MLASRTSGALPLLVHEELTLLLGFSALDPTCPLVTHLCGSTAHLVVGLSGVATVEISASSGARRANAGTCEG